MAAAGATFKIVDIVKIPSAEPDRAGKYDLVVTYQDLVGRTRIVTIPFEQWEGKSEEEKIALLKKYIQAEESERLAFIGKEIKL